MLMLVRLPVSHPCWPIYCVLPASSFCLAGPFVARSSAPKGLEASPARAVTGRHRNNSRGFQTHAMHLARFPHGNSTAFGGANDDT